MQKQTFKKVVTGVLAAVLSVSLLTGCGGIKADQTVMKVGDEDVSMGLANFSARYQQAMYESYYGISEDSWNQNIDEKSTYEDNVKDEIIKLLQNMILERQHADDFDAALTDEEKEAAKTAAEAFMKANDSKAEEVTTASKETVQEYLELMTIQHKVEEAIKATVKKEDITDKEAAQKKMTYVYFAASTTDEAGNVTMLEGDEKEAVKESAEEFAKGAAEAEDFSAYADEEGYTAEEATFDVAAETPDLKLCQAADKLEVGGVTEAVEGETGYYVAQLTSDLDRAATDAKKTELYTQKQEEAVEDQLKAWKKDTKIKVYKNRWKKVDFVKQGVTFKQEEAEEESTSGN